MAGTRGDCWRWLHSRACPLPNVCSGKGKAGGVGVLAACTASVILLTVCRRKLGMAGEVEEAEDERENDNGDN